MIKKSQVKNIVIVKLGNPDNFNDDIFNISFDEACSKIKNYCSIEDIPLGLCQTLTNMIRDLYLFYKSFIEQSSQSEEETPTENISVESIDSIKMGDVTISLKDEVVVDKAAIDRDYSQGHEYNIDKLIETYADDLNEYRRLTW